ncbi:hypothetical protein NQ314_003683 [Rhamnusium bicolor]|uniref:Uncharacterized protein n=1 Tax=Rhamnusium bicolor TaxID=1586634 RepID=A0AAV8ZL49_9CUCU|nr:hypothetical protein NQ314_003683 [Rhamnusium bicolor]
MCDEYEDDECFQLKKIITKILDAAVIVQDTVPDEGEAKKITISDGKSPELEKSPSKTISKNNIKRNKPVKENVIPFYYRNTNQIIEKERAPYRMHGAIALQTQNYPCCANFKNFPNCVLRPGETYKHTITYKFWVRAGNPNKWIKRNLNGGQHKSLS